MNQDSKIIIANNIKKLREQAKLTREKLSLILELENSYISKLENKRINITIDKLDKIANYFNIKTFELLIPRD
ncbi:MAG: helix-turn-helix transcriptional regulator [Candidatus Gastranaerophilales bacterium]|nr:helix-turn-helix transcriptional regulator [Candidatus Gastranaerophilales bacterium]